MAKGGTNFFDFLRSTFTKEDVVKAVSALASLIAVLSTLIGFIKSPLNETDQNEKRNLEYLRQQRALLSSLSTKIDSIQRATYAIDTTKRSASAISNEVKKIRINVDSLEKRFTRIESIIIKDPAEVLEIPLIKREIDDIKILNQSKFDTINKDVERAYNIILVSLAGLAVAVFAPVLSSILQRRKKDSPES